MFIVQYVNGIQSAYQKDPVLFRRLWDHDPLTIARLNVNNNNNNTIKFYKYD